MINNNLEYESNSNSDTNTASSTSASTNSNDNSYFARFDNRIAANLAAVLNNVSRFRSAFVDRNTASNVRTKSPTKTTTVNHKNNFADTTSSDNAQRQTNPPLHLQLSNTNQRLPSTCSLPSRSSPQNSSSQYRSQRSLMHRQQKQQRHLKNSTPLPLVAYSNLNCNIIEKQTPSSDEDNSPTELNNCRRLTDKPPLVKRLTMCLSNKEDVFPLVHNEMPDTESCCSENKNNITSNYKHADSFSKTNHNYSAGYINDDDSLDEKLIASKFGDSCRQSLNAIPLMDNLNLNENSEFNLKKRYLRETSSANSSPKIFANRLRSTDELGTPRRQYGINHDCSMTNVDWLQQDETELKNVSWFQSGISRDIAIEILSSKSPGAFLVRKSSSKPGCYALTLRVPSPPGPKVTHYVILKTEKGYKIKGFRKEFPTLMALITHHSVMPELLPLPLSMPRPTNVTCSRRNLDDFDSYDSLQILMKYIRAKTLENE